MLNGPVRDRLTFTVSNELRVPRDEVVCKKATVFQNRRNQWIGILVVSLPKSAAERIGELVPADGVLNLGQMTYDVYLTPEIVATVEGWRGALFRISGIPKDTPRPAYQSFFRLAYERPDVALCMRPEEEGEVRVRLPAGAVPLPAERHFRVRPAAQEGGDADLEEGEIRAREGTITGTLYARLLHEPLAVHILPPPPPPRVQPARPAHVVIPRPPPSAAAAAAADLARFRGGQPTPGATGAAEGPGAAPSAPPQPPPADPTPPRRAPVPLPAGERERIFQDYLSYVRRREATDPASAAAETAAAAGTAAATTSAGTEAGVSAATGAGTTQVAAETTATATAAGAGAGAPAVTDAEATPGASTAAGAGTAEPPAAPEVPGAATAPVAAPGAPATTAMATAVVTNKTAERNGDPAAGMAPARKAPAAPQQSGRPSTVAATRLTAAQAAAHLAQEPRAGPEADGRQAKRSGRSPNNAAAAPPRKKAATGGQPMDEDPPDGWQEAPRGGKLRQGPPTARGITLSVHPASILPRDDPGDGMLVEPQQGASGHG